MSARPTNPRWVLAPGVGQVLNREPVRGFIFLFFILLLGGYTLKTAASDVSIVGKFAGGIFVYAMSILDAYKRARIRGAVWSHSTTQMATRAARAPGKPGS